MSPVPIALMPTPPTTPQSTDPTALASFAALGGQLRISLTPHCNIDCWFCHNEGDVPPRLTRKGNTERPRPRELTAEDYRKILTPLIDAGLRRLYFTGGEPLASKLARPVLEAIPHHERGELSATMITNGLLLRRNIGWLASTALDKVKVSLHYFSDDSLKAIAGTDTGIAPILDGIEAARESFGAVEINTLLQRQNSHEVLAILDFALREHLPIQFIELIDTGFNATHRGDAVPADALITHLRSLGAAEQILVAGVGQGKRVFTLGGDTVEVIHSDLGRYHVGQCGTCPKRLVCVEGFWALRLDHAGFAAPCLLRDDLRLDLKPHLDDPNALAAAVAGHLAAFTEGTL